MMTLTAVKSLAASAANGLVDLAPPGFDIVAEETAVVVKTGAEVGGFDLAHLLTDASGIEDVRSALERMLDAVQDFIVRTTRAPWPISPNAPLELPMPAVDGRGVDLHPGFVWSEDDSIQLDRLVWDPGDSQTRRVVPRQP